VTDRRLVILPILAILLTACTSSSSRDSLSGGEVEPACCPPPQDATVSGVLVGVGGPARAAVQHWSGTIHVSGAGFTTLRTDSRGHFSADLAPGTYRFTATSPSYDEGRGECMAPGPVRLRSHATVHVRVLCQLK
jgi:hypothetical protein